MAKRPHKNNRDSATSDQPAVCAPASPKSASNPVRVTPAQQSDAPIPACCPEPAFEPTDDSGSQSEVVLRLAHLVGRQIAREQFERRQVTKPSMPSHRVDAQEQP